MNELEKIDIFRQFTDFNNSDLAIIMPYFEFKKFKKKSILLEVGKVSNEVFYLIKGCIRLYCEKILLNV